jgi:hypothetical protein
MKIKSTIISILILLLTSASSVFSQEKTDEGRLEKKQKRELFYTYIGPVAGFGGNYIWKKGWDNVNNIQQDYSYQGLFVKGGLMLNVFAKNFSGDFTIEYNYSMNQVDPVMGIFLKITGKYVFKISEVFNLALGVGGYFETPPSNNPEFKGGAGVQVPFGMIINTTQDTKLILDFYARFGYYGLGVGSTKLSYGMALSFLFKVGTL